ncbi:CocE/NonD family hydrolase [Actinopolymorpha sp. B9G3]|uniref:CocE/NonD family hydrolase n=1 Tax=Actinopolymorpha sp. B9G3 TaxID=3158970 RepID=UPI0032D94D45
MADWRGQPESPSEFGVLLASDVRLAMRDGAGLATDLFFPADPAAPDSRAAGACPVVLVRTPYNKRSLAMRELGEYFARRGYVTAIQDCRGRYASEGTFDFLVQEPQDGYDTIEWLGVQAWSTGAVGTMGTSYSGWTQTAAAALNPPHLAAMVVNQSGSNAYTSSVRHNGAMELRFLSWAFMEAATTPANARNPELTAAQTAVSAAEWLRRLPLRPGLTPLAHSPSIERWALDLYTRGDYEEFWEQPGFHVMKHWDDFADVPVLFCGAWYDSYTRATIENFTGLSQRKNGPVHLVMGPWTHGSTTVDTTFAGDVEFGEAGSLAGNLADDFPHLHLRWFDRWLKGLDNGVDREDPVRLFVMGAGDGSRSREGRLRRGGEWRGEKQFPPAGVAEVTYHLRGDGSLGTEPPEPTSGGIAATADSTTFCYDPADPVPTIGGNISSLSDQVPVPDALADRIPYEERWASIVKVGGQDQRTGPDVLGAWPPYLPLGARGDVVVFQTEPLAADVTVIGPLSAVLYVSSSAPDTDFTVKLVDVFPPSADYPHGYAVNISDSIFRCRYRNDPAQPEPMVPGEVYQLRIPMYGTGAVFGKGHRIRVDVSSSNFPRFDPNPNTGEPIGRHHRHQVADNTVHHSAAHPSHVVLPVLAD